MAKAKSTRVPPRRFPVRRFFVTSLSVLLLVAIVGWAFFGTQTKQVDAQIAVLYSSVCLGGWKNPDQASGIPQVTRDSLIAYDDENSATLANTMTQLFCGGFTGEIPTNVDRTKIALHFSWQMEGHETFQKQRLDADQIESDVGSEIIPEIESAGSETASTTEPQIREEETEAVPEVEEVQAIEAAEAQPEPAKEEVLPPEEPLSWWRQFVPFAYAQEDTEAVVAEEPEVIQAEPEAVEETEALTIEDEVVVLETASSTFAEEANAASSTEAEVASSSPASSTVSYQYVSTVFDQDKDKADALFEVLFTMNNEEWYTLGYVSRINNDIQFELPLELFTTVEDFNKLQISLKTVERFDDTPKIYLDSIWLEVSYLDANEDPLPPPGTKEGDIIMSSISTQETSLVTVLRGVGLETVSNIMSALGSSTASTTFNASTTTASTSSEALPSQENSTTTTSTSSVVLPIEEAIVSVVPASSTPPVVLFESDIPYEIKKSLRATPGVVVELWLYNRLTGAWARVADNSIIATVPRAVLLDNKVFWFGYENTSLWMFDVATRSYASQSISPNEKVSIEYFNMAGEPGIVWFNPQTEVLEVLPKDE